MVPARYHGPGYVVGQHSESGEVGRLDVLAVDLDVPDVLQPQYQLKRGRPNSCRDPPSDGYRRTR